MTASTTASASTEPSTTDQTSAPPSLSLARLSLLRIGYGVVAFGLVLTKWPLIINHPDPWPLFDGVETCMLVALSLLSFLGLRHPLKLLPILLFELGWKIIWVAVVVLPLWSEDRLDPATVQVFYSCLVVLIVLAVVPWRYVVTQYVTAKAEPWRPAATRSRSA